MLYYCYCCYYYLILRTNYDVESPKEYIGTNLLLGRISNRCKMFERYSLSPKTGAETTENMQISKYLL